MRTDRPARLAALALAAGILAPPSPTFAAAADEPAEVEQSLQSKDWMLVDDRDRLVLLDFSDKPARRSLVVNVATTSRAGGRAVISATYWRGHFKVVRVEGREAVIECRLTERFTSYDRGPLQQDPSYRAADVTFVVTKAEPDQKRFRGPTFSFSGELPAFGWWAGGRENRLELFPMAKGGP
jgi:hypothetical protein